MVRRLSPLHVALLSMSTLGLLQAAQQTIASRTLLATVTDIGNRPLVSLEPDDFVIDEDGRPREILSLQMADYPIAVLLDDTASAVRDADAIRDAAARFIARIGERP